MTHLSVDDRLLVEVAQQHVGLQEIPGGTVGSVAAALRTSDGNIYTGVCMHLVCGLGACAEYSAVTAALTANRKMRVETIVATNAKGVIPACGRCRELLHSLPEGLDTFVIVSDTQKVPLRDLLPHFYEPPVPK